MGWQNNEFGMVKESTYGTAVTSGVKGYALTSETFTPEMVTLEVAGFRSGRTGLTANEYSQTLVGGTSAITVPIPIDNNDLLFNDLLGDHTAYDSSSKEWHEDTTVGGPSDGRTLYMARGVGIAGSTVERQQYIGCIPTSWDVNVSTDSLAELTVNYWWQKRATVNSVTIANVPSVRAYRWTDASVQVGGTDVANVTGFTFNADLGMDTGLAYLDGTAARSKPLQTTVPSYTGTIEMVYTTAAAGFFADWLAGTSRSVKLTLTASDYAAKSGTDSKLEILMPTCRFTGSSPTASPESYTTISLPFMALEPATGDMVQIEGIAKNAA